jgi:hypothetical protein
MPHSYKEHDMSAPVEKITSFKAEEEFKEHDSEKASHGQALNMDSTVVMGIAQNNSDFMVGLHVEGGLQILRS